MRTFVLLYIMMVIAFSSCIKGDCPDNYGVPLQLNVSIANEERVAKHTFGYKDTIGIYIVNYQGGQPGVLGDVFSTARFNVPYSYQGTFWYVDNGEEIFLNSEPSDLYAYFPYDSGLSKTEDKLNLGEYPFNVELIQTEESTKSDFLWTKVNALNENNSRADLIFSHLMSRCVVNLFFVEGEPVPEDPLLKIYNTQTLSSINLRTGVATANGNTQIIIPAMNALPNAGADFTYEAILVPQLIAAGTPLFTVAVNSSTLVYQAENNIEFTPQGLQIFNMTVGVNQLRTN